MPAVGTFGHKWYPEDIAGMLGLPSVGHIWYVDPSAGSDSASGKTQSTALATVAAAYAKCTSGKHDVVLIAPTGGTGRTTEVAPIVWAKRFTHLIGNAAPTMVSIRAGLDFSSAVTVDQIGFTLSENGCIFKNLTFITTEDINVLVKVTGSYNYFGNCHIAGAANATSGADTAWRALLLDGAHENLFENCTIGAGTFTRSAVNANLEQINTCRRNAYKSCFFPMYSTDAGAVFAKIVTGNCHENYVLFDDCMMFAPLLVGSQASLTTAMLTTNTGNGIYIWKNSYTYGAAVIADVLTKVFTTTPVITGANSGEMVIAS